MADSVVLRSGVCLAAVVGACVVTPADDSPQAGDSEFIRALAEAYREHLERLTPLRCEYTIESGITAVSLTELSDGQFRNPPDLSFDGLLLRKGDYVLSRLDCRQPPREIRVDDSTGVTIGSSERYLTGNGYHVQYGVTRGMAKLLGSDDDPSLVGPDVNPLNMGVMGPSDSANPYNLILNDSSNVRYLGSREHFGTTLEGVAVPTPGTDADTEIWFATGWGFLPARMVIPLGSGNAEIVLITEAQSLSADRWFPTKVLRFSGPADGMESFETAEVEGDAALTAEVIKTTNIDVETPPDDAEFTLDLPAGTLCGHRRNLIRLKEPHTVSAAGIPALIQQLNDRITRGGPPRGDGNPPADHSRLWIIALNAVVIPVVLVLLLSRKRRRA